MRCGGVSRARSVTDSCRSGGFCGRSVIPRSIRVEPSTESFSSYLTAMQETELTGWDPIVAGQPGDRPGTGCPQPAVRKSALTVAGQADLATHVLNACPAQLRSEKPAVLSNQLPDVDRLDALDVRERNTARLE